MYYGSLSLVLEAKDVSMGTKAKALAYGALGGLKGIASAPILGGMNMYARMADDYHDNGVTGLATGLGKAVIENPGKLARNVSNMAHQHYYSSTGDKAKHKEYTKKQYDMAKSFFSKETQKKFPKFKYAGID